MMASPSLVPPACKWLGGLGALPFLATALAALLLEGAARDHAVFALLAYGAVILSILGGIHWGLAMAGFGPAIGEGPGYRRLTVSILPALVSWCALLLPSTPGLLTLAAAFLAMLAIDFQTSRQGESPAWYPRLRWPLTSAVVASIALGAFA